MEGWTVGVGSGGWRILGVCFGRGSSKVYSFLREVYFGFGVWEVDVMF